MPPAPDWARLDRGGVAKPSCMAERVPCASGGVALLGVGGKLGRGGGGASKWAGIPGMLSFTTSGNLY